MNFPQGNNDELRCFFFPPGLSMGVQFLFFLIIIIFFIVVDFVIH